MKIIGKQIVVELPTEAKGYSGQEEWMKGWNQALCEVARMNPAWEVDIRELAHTFLKLKWKELHDVFLCSRDGEAISDYGSCYKLAQALTSDPLAWMKRKDSDDKEKV